MEAKDRLRTELELVAAVSKLEISMKKGLQRISDLKQYEDSGSANEEELEAIRLAGEQMRKRAEDPASSLPSILRDQILRPPSGTPCRPTKKAMRKMIVKLEADLEIAEELHGTLDKSEKKLRMYNLPKRSLGEPLEAHLEKVREYMAVSWREAAESLRAKDYKCLADWIVKLDESADEKRRDTSRALTDVLVEIGAKISHFLIDYIVLAMASFGRKEIAERLDEVETVIKSLSIAETSVVVDRFVALVGFARRTMLTTKNAGDRDDEENKKTKDESIVGRENGLFHLIAVEILRLEVSFSSPDLPMMLLNEVFLAMGRHLTENVFEDKLGRIAAEIDGMKKDCLSGEKDYVTNFFERVLYLGIKNIWDELEFNNAKSQDDH